MELEGRNGVWVTDKYLSILILMLSRVKNLHILEFAADSHFHGLLGEKRFQKVTLQKTTSEESRCRHSFPLLLNCF